MSKGREVAGIPVLTVRAAQKHVAVERLRTE